MEGGPLIVNATNHIEHRSISAFLSYFVYSAEEGGAYNGEPVLTARKCNHAPHLLLPNTELRDDDLANWALYRTNDTLYLAFRGTHDAADVVTDVNAIPNTLNIGRVEYSLHSGFLAVSHSYDTIVQHIKHHSKEYNCRQLIITGHSLGGAHAQVFGLIYDRDAELVECPALHSIITFAAPQSCINPPPPSLWQNKCINYIVLHDPVPCVPYFAAHRLAVLFTTKLATNSSFVARFVSSITQSVRMQIRAPGYVARYHSLVNAMLIRPTNHELAYLNPVMHHQHVRDMTWDQVIEFNTSSHKMLFYLGELRTLNLLNDVVKNWFDGENARASPQRYSDTFRSMISVYMLWTEQIYAIVHPIDILPVNALRVLVRHTLLLGEGSTYLFIDPTTTAEQLDELKKEYIDMKNDGVFVELYEPGDYSWMDHVSDIRLLLETVHPLAFWERNSGALDHYEKRDLNMKDKSDMNAFEVARHIAATKSHDNPEYCFAKLLLEPPHALRTSEARLEPNIQVSICALLTMRAAMSLPYQHMKFRDIIVSLYACGEQWAIYVCDGAVYIVFHYMVTEMLEHFTNAEWVEQFIGEICKHIPSHLRHDESLPLLATGHYFGGALAQIFVIKLLKRNARAITFGAPPIVLSQRKGCNIVNYVRGDDPLPRLNQDNIAEDAATMFVALANEICNIASEKKSALRLVGDVIELPGSSSSVEESNGNVVWYLRTMKLYWNVLPLIAQFMGSMPYYIGGDDGTEDDPRRRFAVSTLLAKSSKQVQIDEVSICALLTMRMEKQLPHEQIDILGDDLYFHCCDKDWAAYSYQGTIYIVFSYFPLAMQHFRDFSVVAWFVNDFMNHTIYRLLHDASLPLVVTGHYFGGALAQALFMRLRWPNARAITFGAPPILASRREEPTEFEKSNMINYVRNDDVLPLLNGGNTTFRRDYSQFMRLDENEMEVFYSVVHRINHYIYEGKLPMRHLGTIIELPGEFSVFFWFFRNYYFQSMRSYSEVLPLNEKVKAFMNGNMNIN